ncbi:MAG: flagellar motor switch protein FliG [Candidatus Marinimicrobia bacterium]|nr:flagellar motor switch protein FliG [Candidatus Neomarinimicrobiota bacterium]
MKVPEEKEKKKSSKSKLNNYQKSALILIAMGTDNAANVLKFLNEKEVEKVSIEIARLEDVSADALGDVIEEYYEMMLANQYIVQGGMGYARKVLEQAWGVKKAEEIINRVEASTQVSAFYMLRTVDDKQLLNFLQNEHPQTAALILANLKPTQAAAILNELPSEIQGDIVYRLATMEKTSPELIADIETVLKDQMGSAFGGDLSATGGAESVAEILNSTSRAAEKNILEQLKEQDAKLADEIASLMFLFEDIIHLPETAIQTINKDINTKTLALALKATSIDLKDKFMRNMSERAGDMLKEEIEYLGPVRVRDVDIAQSEILEVVRTLEASGDISLGRGAEEEIIE